MEKTFNVLVKLGNVNAAGQKAECFRAVEFGITLDNGGIAGVNLPLTPKHAARIKNVVFADKAAHQAGRPHDPTAAFEQQLDVSKYPTALAALENLFDVLMPIAAAELWATVDTVTFDIPDEPTETEL